MDANASGAVYIFVRTGAAWTPQAYIKASNTHPGDLFGISVALSGDTLAVGASQESSNAIGVNCNNDLTDLSPTNGIPDCQENRGTNSSGAVFVFARTGSTWSQQAYIKASNAGGIDLFGSAVGLDGNTLAVGAWRESSKAKGVDCNNNLTDTSPANGIPDCEEDNSANDSGAVYVFSRTGTGSNVVWTQDAYIKASNAEGGDAFGRILSVSGNTLAVGADLEDSSARGVNCNNSIVDTSPANGIPDCQDENGANSSGAVYVFVRKNAAWSQQAYIKASNTASDSLFGGGVALSGDTLAVSADLEDSNATGVNCNGDLADTNPANGVPDCQENVGAGNSGAVYIFERADSIWTQKAYIKASNTQYGDEFGFSLALVGETLAVGAPYEDGSFAGMNCNNDLTDVSPINGIPDCQDNNGANGSGAVYVFTRGATAWTQQAYVKASNTGNGDNFGWRVALSTNTLAVGAIVEASNALGINCNNDLVDVAPANGIPDCQDNNGAYSSGAVYVFK